MSTILMAQDIRLFGATKVIVASPKRVFVLSTTYKSVTICNAVSSAITASFQGKVLASYQFQAPTGAMCLISYNTSLDTGTVWVSLTDGTLWSIPVNTTGFTAAPTQFNLNGAKISSAWMTPWGHSGLVVPLKGNGVLWINSGNGQSIQSLEGIVGSRCTFGISNTTGPLYLFDAYARGYQVEFTGSGIVSLDGSWPIAGGENVIDGAISSTALAIVCGARSTVQAYTLAAPALPTLVLRDDYDAAGYTVVGVANTTGAPVLTTQEYNPLGLAAWFAVTGGRDAAVLGESNTRYIAHGNNGRLQCVGLVVAQGGIGFDIIGTTLKVG